MSHSETAKTAASKPRKARILIIEDSLDHWTIIQNAINESFDLPVAVRVSNAEQALSYLQNAQDMGTPLPQVVLLDLYLPTRQQGWQFLENVKNQPAPVSLIPVVVLSHSSDPADIVESYDRGASSYLTKPTDLRAWQTCFQTLSEYWWDAVRLPESRSFQ
ncbi:response regulator [Larkinella arboricola]|uniref:CheY-like chemotaxis protein n=1 Tax=Larkinella arboricola TaxID=643671 RepID=A0A327WY81_LARAB|nr:response regulator [Larkinella arboricola]RAJ97405.1 CheY-like chemotaxis protein [Larkinella arboricola]